MRAFRRTSFSQRVEFQNEQLVLLGWGWYGPSAVWTESGLRVATYRRFTYRADAFAGTPEMVRAHVSVWNGETGQRIGEHVTMLDLPDLIVLAPDGQTFVAAEIPQVENTMAVELWRVGGYDPVVQWAVTATETTRYRFSLAYSSDGRRIASIEGDEIVIRETATGAVWRRIRHGRNLAEEGAMLAWIDDNRSLVWLQTSGRNINDNLEVTRQRLMAWDVAMTGRLIAEFSDADSAYEADPQTEQARLIAPDGSLAVLHNRETGVHVWSFAENRRIARYSLPDGMQIREFSPDGEVLLAVSDDNQLFLLDPLSGLTVSALHSPRMDETNEDDHLHEFIVSTSFSGDGQSIYAVTSRNNTYRWRR